MDENNIPPALRETFQYIRQDFTLNLESDATDLAIKQGRIREMVGDLPVADPGAKKEIMKILLTDPSYLQYAFDSLQKTCQARGVNPVDAQVFMDVIRALAADGKMALPI